MITYIWTMMILGWIAFIVNLAVLVLEIQLKARTKGQIAFGAIVGLAATLWAMYLIFGVSHVQ